MALPGLLQHRKFGRLARALGSKALALGVLELLWAHAYEVVSPVVGDATDLAYVLDWPTDPAAVIAALVAAGWLDETAPGEYAVHDLWDHCPQYVRRRRDRAEVSRARRSPCVSQVRTGDHKVTALPGQASTEQKNSAADASLVCRLPVENADPPPACLSLVENPQPDGAARVPNWRTLARVGFDLVHARAFDDEAEFRDALKDAAGQLRIPYDGPTVTRATETVVRTHAARGTPVRFTAHQDAPRRVTAGDG